MGFKVQHLWQAPEVNPLNSKARSIPGLNPINKYGRVFFFSWFGFMIAFLSWYAFPPLLTVTIKKDLKLSQNEIANSNIIALTATLLVRVIAGPACDHFGPRRTFAGCLLIGAIPTALAGTIHNATGLYVIRFFIGILGGSFVPCQVWSTGFFDKNVVGTSNALTAGFGNSGGGITYFVMPAIFDSLVRRGERPHKAWRVSFVVPFIIITAVAVALLLLCQDTPNGKWSDRHLKTEQNIAQVVDVPGGAIGDHKPSVSGSESPSSVHKATDDKEAQTGTGTIAIVEETKGEIIQKPTFREAFKVAASPQTLVVMFCYFCTFGAELAINSILGTYYAKNFPKLGQTGSGNWAAMFGLLNVVFRPLGGIGSDLIYRHTKSLWLKKSLIHILAIITGCFQLAIGLKDSHNKHTMFGLIAGMALFLEAGNGATFSLVPHVHPYANGIVSGFTGATGNLGGIIFAIIFRYHGKDYAKAIWIIGCITIAINVAISWIRPIPKNQIGGH